MTVQSVSLRTRDTIALVKLISDIALRQVVDVVDDGKDPPTVELGRLGRPPATEI